MRFALVVAAAGVATASPILQSNKTWTVGQDVRLSNSFIIKGHAATWPENSGISEYLGIPYAKAPVGNLRFLAPQPYTITRNQSFVADKYAPDCIQMPYASGPPAGSSALASYGVAMGGRTPESPRKYDEDCLAVNVWTKPQVGEDKKAVLVWIHGGAFSSGTSNALFYNGGRLVQEEDVIVVSFNYRVNIFGFPLAPGLPDANPGLLDQRLAIEWVRDNIAPFGGDPGRITIFGESAGGASVDYYSYAWANVYDAIVNGFIVQSGTATLEPPSTNTKPPSDIWYGVSLTAGCGGAEAGRKTLECMREKSTDEIVQAVGKMVGGDTQTPFGPHADGKTVFSDKAARAAAGNFIKRPLLVGQNDNELSLKQFIASALGRPSTQSAPSTTNSAGLSLDAQNDALFTCPAATAASARIKAGVKAWRYRYMGVFENTMLAPGLGSYHSSEIPLVFGATERRPGVPKDTEEEIKLGKAMRHAWAEFAKDPDNGLVGLGWPVYDPEKPTLVRLGWQNKSEPNFASNAEYDKRCASLTTPVPG